MYIFIFVIDEKLIKARAFFSKTILSFFDTASCHYEGNVENTDDNGILWIYYEHTPSSEDVSNGPTRGN